MSPEIFRRYVEQGDVHGLEDVIVQFGNSVYATCREVLGDSTETHQAARQTFMLLTKRAGVIRSPLGVWLHACARLTALEWLEKRIAEESGVTHGRHRPDTLAANQNVLMKELLARHFPHSCDPKPPESISYTTIVD
jgi:DNA-directed RNA polymerase specialized sigma24 family protein